MNSREALRLKPGQRISWATLGSLSTIRMPGTIKSVCPHCIVVVYDDKPNIENVVHPSDCEQLKILEKVTSKPVLTEE
jgi:hypothetical protein